MVFCIRLISELKVLFSFFGIRTVSTNRGKALAIRHCDVIVTYQLLTSRQQQCGNDVILSARVVGRSAHSCARQQYSASSVRLLNDEYYRNV